MSNSQQDRKSIVFYRSFYDSIRELPDDAQLIIYRAIMEYSFDFKEEMDLSGLPKAIFILIKPLLDSNLAKYKAGIENGYKGADSGKKGGRPSKKPSTDENKNPQETLIKPSNVDVDVDVDVDTCTSRLSSKFLFGCKIHPSSRPQLREARRRMDGKTINKNTTTGGH